ncbi:hypothetical protein EF888_04355 [Silicimonas algicola]|uniref:hypothetical protein n=1 Tax=Silicimonas algicola TaxID=1826607 RepID=UPI000F850D23|nr:hypothetical protein [Silicimonas algicola]AZQ66432.1 hypothetical protein EF888_04355 [Silicimonas algicola]
MTADLEIAGLVGCQDQINGQIRWFDRYVHIADGVFLILLRTPNHEFTTLVDRKDVDAGRCLDFSAEISKLQ